MSDIKNSEKLSFLKIAYKIIAFEIFNQISSIIYQNYAYMRNLVLHQNVFYKQ